MAAKLPQRFLFPTIIKARDLLKAGTAIRDSMFLARVVDLPVDLSHLSLPERDAVFSFLDWARVMRADKSFIATHRPAWWAVGLREPAPILCTYMARRAPSFVRNYAGARHINIAHGLYPREPMNDSLLDALAGWLREHITVDSGRTYAGGLTKFEPKEIERLWVPSPDELAG
jgi:hypothetical protein